jgi:hypothetical protein
LSASGGIPASLRKKYGLHPGKKIKFWHSHSFGRNDVDSIRIIPLVTKKEIQANIGFLRIKGKSLLKALMKEKPKIRLARLNDGLRREGEEGVV